MVTKVPCKDCVERSLGCHSQCSSYREYRSNLNRINAMRRQQEELEWTLYDTLRRGRHCSDLAKRTTPGIAPIRST